MANSYLSRTPGTATNNNKFTLSVWAKRSALTGDYQAIFASRISGGGGSGLGLFWGNDNSVWYNSGTSSSAIQNTSTSAKFRDTSAWYHIVVAGDTTQSGTDKLKIWVNGVQQTSFGNDGRSSFVGLSYDLGNATYANEIGRKHDGTYYYNGYLSHIAFVDGTALTPTSFGETDSTSGIWKFKSPSGVTWGTNGFHLKFENSGALGTDSSGNSNTFTVNGNLKQALDTPSNVHATFNPLHNTSATMSNGNLTGQSTNSNYISGVSTLGTKTGKFYAEFKLIAESASGESVIGVTGLVRPTSAIVGQTGNFGIRNNNGLKYYTENGSAYTGTSQHGNFTVNDIIGVALDMDNGRVYFSKNGGWWNGASTWTGASPSSYITMQTDIFDEFFFECGDAASGHNATWSANFGNGFFGTTAITSAGSNGNGSLFEYDVPSGYYALNTKNINTYG